MARLWLERSLLVVSGIVTGLLLAEGAVRLSGLAPPVGLFTVSEAEFRRIPGTFAPGQTSVEAEGTRFEHTVTINDLGYRGAAFPREKPGGERRILFAGDSFTWGHNVGDDQTLPARLEQRLVLACGPTRVVNAGLSGSTILGQQAIIERGMVVDPDLVILMYHENDIDELIHTRMWDQLAANRRVKSRPPVSLVYPIVRTSALWNLAQHVRRVLSSRGSDVRRSPETSGPSAADVDRARAEYAERLRAIRDTLAERGVAFVFVTFPHPDSVTEGSGGRDYPWVLDLAAELEIPTLDLLPVFDDQGPTVEEAYLVPHDYHPSPEGHDFAASSVEAFLLGGRTSYPPCGSVS